MNRHALSSMLVPVAALGSLTGCSMKPKDNKPEKKPNIIVIMTDDHNSQSRPHSQ